MFKNKRILITGGTGSWGHTLVSKLLAFEPKEIRIFSRGEQKQVEMEREFNSPCLHFVIGDVRDLTALTEACQNIDYVFHLAALKHVPVCEIQPLEAIKTNIYGTENVIEACIKNKVKKAIYVSTDKAVEALNLYGMTKSVGERLIIQANQKNSNTRFVCIRAGNVLGSNGSVVPLFLDQIHGKKPLTLTHHEMTRYFITLSEAIDLLLEGVKLSLGGEIFVMHMPSYRIKDIAQVLIELTHSPDLPIIETGIRSGEKLHEVLVSKNETPHTYEIDANYYVILPTIKLDELTAHYDALHLKKVTFTEYTSHDETASKAGIQSLLEKAGFVIN